MANPTTTTLSAAITASQTTFNMASATGLSNPTNGYMQKIYVQDTGQARGELMTVISFTGTTVTVSRLDLFKSGHLAGATVYIQDPNPLLEPFFVDSDPVVVPATTPVQQTVLNVTTGRLSSYSTTTGSWSQSAVGGDTLTATVAIPNAQVLTLYSVGVQLVAAQGAGTLIEVVSVLLENVYKTAAFQAGGVIQASYGTGVTTPASATVAATFLTSPSANQAIILAGAVASGLSSAYVNTAVRLACATQDFTVGGGSVIVQVVYRVHSGL